jgi:hypothetical protein
MYPPLETPQITSRISDRAPRAITALSDPAAYVNLYNVSDFYIGLKDAQGNRVYPILYEGTYYGGYRGNDKDASSNNEFISLPGLFFCAKR